MLKTIIKFNKSVIIKETIKKYCIQNASRTSSSANNDKIDKNQILQEAQEFEIMPCLENISPYHWQELVQLKSKAARRKYFKYLWVTERCKETKRLKQKEKQRHKHSPVESTTESHLFLYRTFPSAVINTFLNNRLARAMQFGQKLIIDCSYEDNMTHREIVNTAEQLKRLFATNRNDSDPFDIHFCHASPTSNIIKSLRHRIPTLFNPEYPINLWEGSYLEKFPDKQNLVYLTPDSDTVLERFSHDDVYIIGALVDRVNNFPHTLMKARQEGLRTAKLPLNGYRTALAMNQVVSILLDLKATNDWKYVLEKNVPKRKLLQIDGSSNYDLKLKSFKESRFSEDIWGGQKLKRSSYVDVRDKYLRKVGKSPNITISVG